MPKYSLSLIEYNSLELHPLIANATWYLSNKEVATAFNTPISTIINSLDNLIEDKHYSYESVEYDSDKKTSSILFFSKMGIIRLAYYLKTDESLKFLEFIEDINFKENEESKTHSFYKEIEEVLRDRLIRLKNNPDSSLEEINHFIVTLDNLIRRRDNISQNNTKQNSSNFGDILETVVQLAQNYAIKK